MGYKGDLGSSPLDGIVSFIDDIRHGSRAAKKRAKAIRDAPKKKVQAIMSSAKPEMCKTIGHKGKRGGHCERCTIKIL